MVRPAANRAVPVPVPGGQAGTGQL